jgi:hypothetical protein
MSAAKPRLGATTSRRIGVYVGALTLIALCAVVLVGATGAAASTQATIYVSPTGSGSSCTSNSPCSLSGAKTAVEAINSSMTGDIIVQLAGGTYRLSSTFTLTGADSGSNGYSTVGGLPMPAPRVARLSGFGSCAPGTADRRGRGSSIRCQRQRGLQPPKSRGIRRFQASGGTFRGGPGG